MDYKGNKCPVCGIEFQDGDDIVVCPDCGAPYHRACYLKEGKCLLSHENGAHWVPQAKTESAADDLITCKLCNAKNPKDAVFCNRCGNPLKEEASRPQTQANPGAGSAQGSPFAGVPVSVFSPTAGFDPAEELEDGVTVGDVSNLVITNPYYYLPLFRRIRDRNKSRFNFCAFLFSGGWFVYRKQYKLGIPFTVLMTMLHAGYLLLTYFVSGPLAANLLTQAGIDTTQTLSFTAEQAIVISSILKDNPTQYLLLLLPMLLVLTEFVLMLVSGFMGNRMYYKHCISTAKQIKAQGFEGQAYISTLRSHGGVNTSVMFILFVVYMVLTYAPGLLL